MWWRRTPKPLGQRGEDLAAKHLKRSGYKILGRNVWLGRYEVDILARDGDTVVFVEVRSKTSDEPVPPEDSVGYTKRQHLRKAALFYLIRHEVPGTYYRFDVVAVVAPAEGKATITLYRDAFPAEE
jgi:putative endonuclease